MRIRTSPASGSGSLISPTISTSAATPCFSYHAAFIFSDHFRTVSLARPTELANGLGAAFGGQAQASPHTKAGALPFRVFCESAGLLADIVADCRRRAVWCTHLP